MYRNDYHKNMEESCKKALSVRPPGSVEEFMKQCDEGKEPYPECDSEPDAQVFPPCGSCPVGHRA